MKNKQSIFQKNIKIIFQTKYMKFDEFRLFNLYSNRATIFSSDACKWKLIPILIAMEWYQLYEFLSNVNKDSDYLLFVWMQSFKRNNEKISDTNYWYKFI